MSKKISSIPPDMNAKEALAILLKSKLSGIPVIDGGGDLAGVFTEKEILQAILPAHVKHVGAFVYAETSKAEIKKLASLETLFVKDLMRKDVPVIDEEASLTEASRIMLTKSERRIIVIRDKKPVGVITRCDVVKALAEEAGVSI